MEGREDREGKRWVGGVVSRSQDASRIASQGCRCPQCQRHRKGEPGAREGIKNPKGMTSHLVLTVVVA